MKRQRLLTPIAAIVGWCFNLALCPTALAHCDTLDGPVVMDARSALEKAT